MHHNLITHESLTECYAGRTILVTGARGFIGSALVEALLQVRCSIVVLVRPGRNLDLPTEAAANIKAVHGDIRDRGTWLKVLDGADFVFHLAAQTSTYAANRDPLGDLDANAIPVLQMLQACREGGFRPGILFAGSVTQSGIPHSLPVDESERDLPVTVYDIHKLLAEKYLQYYCNQEGVPSVTLRLANVYGPGVPVGSSDRGVLNLMVRRGLGREPLTVYGDGKRLRDYVFIDDVVSALLIAGIELSSLGGEYFVIGSGAGIKIVDAINLVADRVQLASGHRPVVKHVEPPPGMSAIEDRDFVADSNRFKTATGWHTNVSLSEGIDRTIRHYQIQNTARVAGQS